MYWTYFIFRFFFFIFILLLCLLFGFLPTVSRCSEMDESAVLSSTKSLSIPSVISSSFGMESSEITSCLPACRYKYSTPKYSPSLCWVSARWYGSSFLPRKDSLNWLTWCNSDDTCDGSIAMLINLAGLGQLKIEAPQLAILVLCSCQCPCLIPPGQALQQKSLVMHITC